MIGKVSLDIYNVLLLLLIFTFSQDEVDKIQHFIQMFDQYFATQKNIVYQRYLFHTCIKNGRSFDSFLNDIKKQSYFWNFCEFGSLEERLIRDRILYDIDSKEMREGLLRD